MFSECVAIRPSNWSHHCSGSGDGPNATRHRSGSQQIPRSREPLYETSSHGLNPRNIALARLPPRRRIFSLQGIHHRHNRRAVPAGLHARFAILCPVLILYAVYVACTIALIAAAAGIVRHILRHRRTVRSQTDHPDEPL